MTPRVPREALLLFTLGAVQFVNILDFMMVMPLGPFYAVDLDVPSDRVAQVGAAYTGAAAVSGLLLSPLLDRFDRRVALGLAMLGLFLGTVLGGFANTLPQLLASRVLAGIFGGPATALSLAIVTDLIPAARRGEALGKVMGAFAVSSVLGVPMGLWFARHGGWRAPFFAVSGLGLAVGVLAIWVLPPMRAHLESRTPRRVIDVLLIPRVPAALLAVAGMTMASFSVIPSLPMFIQNNLSFPSDDFWKLYFVGGVCAFGMLRLGGRLVDGGGAMRVAGLGTAFLALALGVVALADPRIPPYLLFIAFMSGNSLRNVAWSALATRVPPPDLRAGYLSLQSATQHAASAIGALLSTWVLAPRADGGVVGMEVLAGISLALFLLALVPMAVVERGLGRMS